MATESERKTESKAEKIKQRIILEVAKGHSGKFTVTVCMTDGGITDIDYNISGKLIT
jgi:hypothetical protein